MAAVSANMDFGISPAEAVRMIGVSPEDGTVDTSLSDEQLGVD